VTLHEEKVMVAHLMDCRYLIEFWGLEASPYMQNKHDLAGDLIAVDEMIRHLKESNKS
jgi:hypothetical protein